MATFNVGDLSNALAAVIQQASVSTTTTLAAPATAAAQLQPILSTVATNQFQ